MQTQSSLQLQGRAHTPEKELTLRGLLAILRRRRVIVLAITGGLLSLAVLYCALSTRRYEAVGQLEVQKDASDALGLESMMSGEQAGGDALDANITIQTQADILQSDTLALRVIKSLHLESTPDFRPSFNPIGWLLRPFSPSGASDPPDASLDDSPHRRSHALAVFAKNLQVKPVSGSRLIQVTYLSSDPKLAAAVVNSLAQALIDFSFQTRYNATSQASDWLEGQLSDLRKHSEDLQAQVVELQRESGIVTLGGDTDSNGRTLAYSTVLDQLEQATAALSQAEGSRIQKGALYEVAKTGNPELISGLMGSSILSGASTGMTNSLALIQSLRAQEASLIGQIDEMSEKFGPAYPKLKELQSNLRGIQTSIKAEVVRVGERAKNDYEIAQNIEDSTKEIFNSQKQKANALNNKSIEYAIVRQEAEESRALYESLLGRLKEAGVLAGLRSTNITIVDPGRVPSKPSRPNVPLVLAGALFGGLFLGCWGGLLADILDNKIQDIHELEAQTGMVPLGVLPVFDGKTNRERAIASATSSSTREVLPALQEPNSAYTEAIRAMRTSLLLSRGGAPPQAILVTSSVAGEGKSTLSANLAILLAQQGKKVLLVDADLRRPMLHRRFKLPSSAGLSSILAGQTSEADLSMIETPVPDVSNLHLLLAGPVPPYPAELLASPRMAQALSCWRGNYDFVVFDGAPVLPVTDSVILSQLADATLLVARFNYTERQSLDRSYRLLEAQGQKPGIVLNALERGAGAYYDYYGYRSSTYYGSPEGVQSEIA